MKSSQPLDIENVRKLQGIFNDARAGMTHEDWDERMASLKLLKAAFRGNASDFPEVIPLFKSILAVPFFKFRELLLYSQPFLTSSMILGPKL